MCVCAFEINYANVLNSPLSFVVVTKKTILSVTRHDKKHTNARVNQDNHETKLTPQSYNSSLAMLSRHVLQISTSIYNYTAYTCITVDVMLVQQREAVTSSSRRNDRLNQSNEKREKLGSMEPLGGLQ